MRCISPTNLKNNNYKGLTLPVEWLKSRFSSSWPWPTFSSSNFSILFVLRISCKWWKISQPLLLLSRSHVSAIEWRHCECCTSWPWPAFHGHKFWNVNISKTVWASEKCSSINFIEVVICHRMGPLRMLHSVTLTKTFKVTKIKTLISRKRENYRRNASYEFRRGW